MLKIDATNKNEQLLSKHCGRFSVDRMSEFECFIKKLLSEVQPKRTRCKPLRGQEPISKCFTASDEAFALIVLDNKLHTQGSTNQKEKRIELQEECFEDGKETNETT